MGIKNLFGLFKLGSQTTPAMEIDYLSRIENPEIRSLVANFFDRSVLQIVPQSELTKLVDSINSDVKNGVFSLKTIKDVDTREDKTVTNAHNIMNERQLNSESHKIFMGIIKNYFGKSAYETLNQRKNLNVFNVSEIHVLHQEVFDNLGAAFVNRILNNDLTPESLMIIKDVLTDPEKMKDFKYYYDFYNKHIGDSQVDFESMVKGWVAHRDLVKELRTSKDKLTEPEINAIIEIFKSRTNEKNVRDVKGVRKFYTTKDNKYKVMKAKAQSLYSRGNMEQANKELASAILENFFGVSVIEKDNDSFYISQRDPGTMQRFYDIDDMMNNPEMLEGIFSPEEAEMLKSLFDIVTKSKGYAFDSLLEIAAQCEAKGNYECSRISANILSKIPKTFERDILSTITKVDDMDQRIVSGEKGISIDKNPRTTDGQVVTTPVYRLDGADFTFLSSTIYRRGLSEIEVGENFAESWFEYENGTSHVSCSYSNQDCMSNLEFNDHLFHQGSDRVTYLFDEADIYTMGAGDIFTPGSPRQSDVYSNKDTRIMRAGSLAEQSDPTWYNEVGISRYNYEGEIKRGGKIIPSAILCSDEITPFQARVARQFTRYCVENGLKPEGWKMPIIVVDRKRYKEIQDQKARGLITKNSEYFVHEEPKEKVVEVAEQAAEVARQEQQAIEETVEKQVSSGGR